MVSSMSASDTNLAAISGDRQLTHESLAQNARHAAACLRECGVEQGDVVALMARNGFAYFLLSEAVRYLGANLTPVNWHLTIPEVKYILDDCDAKVVVMHADFATEEMRLAVSDRILFVESVAPEIRAAYGLSDVFSSIASEDSALSEAMLRMAPIQGEAQPPAPALFYTSGTTGKPKAVKRKPVSAEVQDAVFSRTGYAFGLDRGSRPISVMTGPMYHSAPYAYGITVVRRGGTLILQPRFDALELLQLIESHQVTHLHMVPIMFQRLLALPEEAKRRFDLSSLRHVVHGAAPCPPEVKAAMIEWWGPILHEYYAMTELGIIACSDSNEWLSHSASVGRPAPGVDIMIQDDEGACVAAGVVGDICVKHEATDAFSYLGAEEKTRDMQRSGYVVTGDVGYLDEEGFLYISDRKTDMIISGGVNIYPAEIENALNELELVEDAVVFGIPDQEFGESIAAVVVKSHSLSEAELVNSLRTKIAGFKVPRHLKFVESLPREDSGKIKRRQVREQFIQQMRF